MHDVDMGTTVKGVKLKVKLRNMVFFFFFFYPSN
jgi:hypothetical protein